MSQTQTRVVGSGFTTFSWRGSPIAFLESVTDDGQKPVGPAESIHPLDSKYPIEYATPRAMNGGSLTFTIRELWNAPVWQALTGLEGANDIVDVWTVFAADPASVTCQMIIRPPGGGFIRKKTYHNVLITTIDDSESVTLGSLTVARDIGCVYTHSTRETIPA